MWVGYPYSNNNQMLSIFLSIQVHLVYTVDKKEWIENKDGLWNNERLLEESQEAAKFDFKEME